MRLHDPSLRFSSNSLDAEFPLNLFSKDDKAILPNGLPLGSVILLRNLKIQEYMKKPQGVGYPDTVHWYALKPGQVSIYSKQNSSPLGKEAKKHMADLAAWYHDGKQAGKKGTSSVDPNISDLPGKGRKLIYMKDVKERIYFDCVVKLVRTWCHDGLGSNNPQIYVTDYTSHPSFLTAHDSYIGYTEEELQEREKSSGSRLGGHVFPITLFADFAGERETFERLENKYVVIRNIRPKLNSGRDKEGNLLPGALEGNLDIGGKNQIRDEKSIVRLLREIKMKTDPELFKDIDE